jgi:hypothetical protein
MTMILTILEATLEPGRESDLTAVSARRKVIPGPNAGCPEPENPPSLRSPSA